MNTRSSMRRSPQLMSCHNTALLVIDVQEKLVPHIRERSRVVWNVGRLIDAAHILDIPVAATEQYPKGLGPTVPEIAAKLGSVPSKVSFSCMGCTPLREDLAATGVHKVLACGVEAHVCVQQTALDLMAEGFDVYVAVDAVGSRWELDCKIALRRMDSAGATLTTTEAALFEWCVEAGTQQFKTISALVRQPPPAA